MKFILLLSAIVTLDVAALILARFYVEHKKLSFMIFSLMSFALSALVFVELMAFDFTVIISILYAGISSIIITIFYYIVFKERITPGQWVGIALAFLGIVILEL